MNGPFEKAKTAFHHQFCREAKTHQPQLSATTTATTIATTGLASMGQTAIVIGSGMGGLAAAQVLSNHFSSVVLLEKDDPNSLNHHTSLEAASLGPKARPGVMQVARQCCGLLPKHGRGQHNTGTDAVAGRHCALARQLTEHG